MEKNVRELIEAKTRELIEAPTCSSETKEAAVRWLEALGTDREKAETESYISELEEDIMPIEQLIARPACSSRKSSITRTRCFKG